MSDITVDSDDGGSWGGIEHPIQDPEEIRVLHFALDSFFQYAKVAHFNLTHLRRQSFYALPQKHWKLLSKPPFNYLETLDKTDDAIDSNAELARVIARHGLRNFTTAETKDSAGEPIMPDQWNMVAQHSDIDKARSTLRQFYRDWSADGAHEREASYGPVFRALENEVEQRRSQDQDQDQLKVLVPGAGLGRLVFELCRRGYSVEGNEISYHQLLASSYILNSCDRPGKHTIFPWINSFSNHETRANHLRSYLVPDIHPATELQNTVGVGSMHMCAADFLCLYSGAEYKGFYDAIACVFFLDTAPNLIRYLETMHHCLKPGGLLINVGPLLWHFENNAPGFRGGEDDGDGVHDQNNSAQGIADPGSFELADDEVMALVTTMGFDVEFKEMGHEVPYIHDADSMLKTVYRASTWVARRRA